MRELNSSNHHEAVVHLGLYIKLSFLSLGRKSATYLKGVIGTALTSSFGGFLVAAVLSVP